ncbi:hypothetical protein [Sphingobacterium faecium]
MGLLKKLKKTSKAITIKQTTSLYLDIDRLKQQKMLETTDEGVFYTFPELLKMKNSQAFLRKLYIYGRTTSLLAEGDILYIEDIMPDENSKITLATVLADNIIIH